MQVLCGKIETICHEAMSCAVLPDIIGWLVAVSNRLAMTSAGGLAMVENKTTGVRKAAHALPINQGLQSIMDTTALIDAGARLTLAHLRTASCAPPPPPPAHHDPK